MQVVGIELLEEYAQDAANRLDRVFCGDVQEVLANDAELAACGPFDCIIAADVLEHLAEPWRALADAVDLLAARGTVIVSVPNVRFWQTFWHLLVGKRWPLRSSGLFDRTHLRWFTFGDAVRLLEHAGLDVIEVEGVYKLNYYGNKVDGALRPILRRLPMRDFFAYQYVLVGTNRD